jgi:SAM-dependent methyltransferase
MILDRVSLAYWDDLAAGWRGNIPPPLSPSGEEILHCESWADAAAQGASPLHALLLGVTEALATMHWPTGTGLVSADWSERMIRHVWPRAGLPGGAAVVRADWRGLPFRSGSFGMVLGDGCLSAVGTFAAAAVVNREVRRVLRPGGVYWLRCFARPERQLSVPGLIEELRAGRVHNFNLFYFLLAMAVQGDSPGGVVLDSVARAWQEHAPDGRKLVERLGLSESAVDRLERWRGQGMRYFFPSRAELHELARPGFDLLEYRVPAYEWGECFPLLLMRARAG